MSDIQDTTLWCVNITGPDDLIAVATRAEAVDLAARFNDFMMVRFERDPHPYDPLSWAVPIAWPYTADGHAQNLHDLGEYAWLRKTPQPAINSRSELIAALQEIRAAWVTGLDTAEEDDAMRRRIDSALVKAVSP